MSLISSPFLLPSWPSVLVELVSSEKPHPLIVIFGLRIVELITSLIGENFNQLN